MNKESNKFVELDVTTHQQNIYDTYLKNKINAYDDGVNTLLTNLRSAQKGDTFNIYLNCDGGCLPTTIQILNAMSDCKAKITTIADGKVYSATTLIFLSGHEKIVKPFSLFMFHDLSTSCEGKVGDVVQKAAFTQEFYSMIFRKLYKEVLTEEELEAFFNKKEFWFHGAEVYRRLNEK